MVGRDEQVRQVEDWIRETSHGVCWITGKPGVGKSAFMARLAERVLDDDETCGVLHFFRATDPRCNRSKLLDNAILKLTGKLGEPVVRPRDLDARSECLRELVRRLVDLTPSPQAVFLLDGIDEVVRDDPGILRLVESTQQAVWVCAGQNVSGVGGEFDRMGAWLPFGVAGLPPLGVRDARAYLDQECGARIYALIARDRPDTPEGGNDNPFLAELVRRSEGLPLYLSFVAEEVRQDRLSFSPGAEQRLPRDLEAYYERLLERFRVSDEAAVLTPLLALLALAADPLTTETILDLLGRDRLLAREGGAELLVRAIDSGRLLVHRIRARDDRSGYSLYHDSLRTHLRQSMGVRGSVEAAREDFARLARRWRDLPADGASWDYTIRNGLSHLLAAGEVDEAVSQMHDLDRAEALGRLAGPVELADACRRVAAAAPSHRQVLEALARAVDTERAFLSAHPEELLQAVADRCLWSDAPAGEGSGTTGGLTELVEAWRRTWSARPGAAWLHSRRPPAELLDSPTTTVLRGHRHRVTALAVSPDGEWLASGDGGGDVRIWDLRTAESLRKLPGRVDDVWGLAFLGSRDRLLGVAECGAMLLWDAVAGEGLARVSLDERTHCLAVAAQTGLVAAGRKHGLVRQFTEGEPPPGYLSGGAGDAFSVAVDRAGRRLAFGTSCGDLLVREAESGELLRQLPDQGAAVVGLALHPDGTLLASATVDHPVRLYDLETGRLFWDADDEGGRSGRCLAFDEAAERLAIGRSNGVIEVRRVADGELLARLEGHREEVLCLAFAGETIVSGSWDKAIRTWAVPPPGHRPQRRADHESRVHRLAFSPDGRRLASASATYPVQVRIWDVGSGEPRRVLSLPNVEPQWLSWSAAGERLAAVDDCGTLRVWDLAASDEPREVKTGQSRLYEVRLIGAGDRALTWGRAPRVRLWDVTTGRVLATFDVRYGLGGAVQPSPDGRLVSAPSEAGLVVLETSTGELVSEVTVPEVTAVAFCDDQSQAVGTAGGMWLVDRPGERPRRLHGLDGPVGAVAGSSDGLWVAGSAKEAGEAVVWSRAPDQVAFRVVAGARGDREVVGPGEPARRVTDGFDLPQYERMSFSPDGLFFAWQMLPGGGASVHLLPDGRQVERWLCALSAGDLLAGPVAARWLLDVEDETTSVLDRVERRVAGVFPSSGARRPASGSSGTHRQPRQAAGQGAQGAPRRHRARRSLARPGRAPAGCRPPGPRTTPGDVRCRRATQAGGVEPGPARGLPLPDPRPARGGRGPRGPVWRGRGRRSQGGGHAGIFGCPGVADATGCRGPRLRPRRRPVRRLPLRAVRRPPSCPAAERAVV